MLVLGDSHAAMLNHFFDKIGKELGFKARVITASSCVTFPGFDYKRIAEWAHQPCLEQIEAARLHADTATSIFIAGSWSYHVESQEFLEGLEEIMIEARGSMFVLSQVPRFVRDVSRVERFHNIGISFSLKQDENYKIANKVVSDMASKYKNVDFLELSGLAFFSRAPFYKSSIMYFDSHHINEVGAFEYADSALPLFNRMKSEGSLF
ncbi:MAG: SGNH hydrolase domain-containing protein [Pseudomonadota bacterium]